MNNPIQNQYAPDYVSPPGETLLEAIEAMGMSQVELAKRTGRPIKTINEIIKGKTAITPETALQLERVLGIPASFWNNRERHYRETRARVAEREYLRERVGWLKDMPLKAMTELLWIESFEDDVEQLQEVLNFFGVFSPEQWQILWSTDVAFRQSAVFQSDPQAVAAWLRKGEIEAQQIECQAYDMGRFREAIRSARSLTLEPPEVAVPELVNQCAETGVAVVFVPELLGTRTSGATRWLTPTKALIQLSLRYKTADHLWFTFFHEAGHILLHGKRSVFIEGDDRDDGREREADKFAADTLIPPEEFRRFIRVGNYGKDDIVEFAAGIGIAPGIVVGRLQHDRIIPHSHHNDLKIRLAWASA